ncbi:putative AMP deaminase [Vitis vinifera]|uniref:Putative AMP deaminase n=1 Tax=Vitis vinifera TaxID=29760 RepID=A0A438HDC0_VITVI|nr:putative AMP deaminase [Vitis vinifera]
MIAETTLRYTQPKRSVFKQTELKGFIEFSVPMDPGSSSSSSSSSAFPLHMAMAALVGASLMAISAFYVHKRSVDQVLHRLIDIRRGGPAKADDHGGGERGDCDDAEAEVETNRKMRGRGPSRSLDKAALCCRRVSSSLPNAVLDSSWFDEESNFDPPKPFSVQDFSSCHFDKLNSIPSGLPPLQTAPKDDQMIGSSVTMESIKLFRTSEQGDAVLYIKRSSYHINPDCVILKANFQYIGEMIVETCLLKFNLPLDGVLKFLFVLICAEEHLSASHSGSNVRVAPVSRLMTPRSLGGNAFDSAGDSDEEGTELVIGEDTFFNYADINHSVDFMGINKDSCPSLFSIATHHNAWFVALRAEEGGRMIGTLALRCVFMIGSWGWWSCFFRVSIQWMFELAMGKLATCGIFLLSLFVIVWVLLQSVKAQLASQGSGPHGEFEGLGHGRLLVSERITFTLLLDLQDLNSNIQNSTLLPFKVDNGNCFEDQKCRGTKTESNVGVDLHGNGKMDTASGNILGTRPISANTISPLRTIVQESTNVEEEEVLEMIRGCLDLRDTYVYREKVAPWEKVTELGSTALETSSDPFHFDLVETTTHHFRMEDGVVHVYASKNDTLDLFPVASSTTFFTDMHHILRIMAIGNVRSSCHHRLRFLEEKFRLHLLVNADREFLAQKSAPHRDFYNIRKVDTHVHHSACMNQKHLLRFIKSKLRKEPDEVVIFRDGKYLTLREVFESLDLTGHDLNVDLLDVHADKSTFHRFDKFNLKYNPCGQSRLREIFLKQDNLIQGLKHIGMRT